jgi:hypothetical protein
MELAFLIGYANIIFATAGAFIALSSSPPTVYV